MKIGIVSNSELCTYLLQYLQKEEHEVRLYLGIHNVGNAKIADLLAYCTTAGIAVTAERETEDLYRWMEAGNFDSSFIYYYNSRIDVSRGEINTDAIWNIHPGALPFYRGSFPVFWQLKKGEPTIGISIHSLAEEFDAGPVVWEKQLTNMPYFTTGNVNNLVSYVLCEGVDHILKSDKESLKANARVQDEEQASYYRKPAFKDIVIDWQNMSAEMIEDLVKACKPWNAGAWTYYNFVPLTLLDVEALEEQTTAVAGTITALKKTMQVACEGGTVLQVNFLRLNEEFINTKQAEHFGFIEGTAFNDPPHTASTN